LVRRPARPSIIGSAALPKSFEKDEFPTSRTINAQKPNLDILVLHPKLDLDSGKASAFAAHSFNGGVSCQRGHMLQRLQRGVQLSPDFRQKPRIPSVYATRLIE
jgi:hypothetical protein